MQINHLSSYYHGGASIAARRLHDSLVEGGFDSRFYYCQYDVAYRRDLEVQDPTYKCVFINNSIVSKCYRAIRSRIYPRINTLSMLYGSRGFEKFRTPNLYYKTPFTLLDRTPAILHLHWVSEFIDYPSFFASIPKKLPVVWTMHDMSAFTAGCSYAWECEGFKTVCLECPQLAHNSKYDHARECFRIKNSAFRESNIHVVADSIWIEKEARSSALFSDVKSFQTIHYGLNSNLFTPRDKIFSRKALGIPGTKTVVAFGALDISNRRKGMEKLRQALAIIAPDDDLLILSFGKGKPIQPVNGLRIEHLGYINSPEKLSSVYSAADLFVMPSLYEAFGQTALEAMACGTPVVGFETGGIQDMIIPEHTGLLAKAKNENDLAIKIQSMIDRPKKRIQMGKQARELVEKRFTLNHQLDKYMALYEKIAGCVG